MPQGECWEKMEPGMWREAEQGQVRMLGIVWDLEQGLGA
jgi:hypothetical protein